MVELEQSFRADAADSSARLGYDALRDGNPVRFLDTRRPGGPP